MRKLLWQLHGWLGLSAGLGLLLVGLSGSLLVFHVELAALFSPERHVVDPTATAVLTTPVGPVSDRTLSAQPAPLPTSTATGTRPDHLADPAITTTPLALDTALRRIEQQLPEYELTGWQLQNEHPDRAQHLYLIRRGTNEWLTTTFDPYTGRVLGAPHRYDEALHGWLVEFHSALFAGDLGVAFAGLLAIGLCLLGLSGAYLHRDFWRHFFTLRWARGARILCSDLHKFIGIASMPLNLALGFTGAYWNLSHTAVHLVEEEHEQAVIDRRLYPESLSLAAAVADSAARLPGFRANFISLPSDPTHPTVILWGAVEPRPLLARAYSSTVSYDPATGEHLRTNDFRATGPWKRFVDTFEAVHFGAFGGLPTKTLWCLAGLAPAALALSGFAIWALRRRGSRSGLRSDPMRRADAPAANPKEPVTDRSNSPACLPK